MRLADAIAKAVVREGVEVAFNLPDEVTVFVAQALHEQGVRIVRPRHEQNAVLMADGYARASNGVGLCLLGAGPALAQTGTALLTAERRRSQLLVLLGQAPRNRGGVKGFDARRFVEATCAQYLEIRSPGTAAEDIQEAFRLVRLARGPVVLAIGDQATVKSELPGDFAYAPAKRVRERPVEPDPEGEEIQEAAAMLADARRPLIVAGRGAVAAGARDDIVALADRIGALLATSVQARELFRGHPRAVGPIGGFATRDAAELIAEADCVLAVGIALNPYQWLPQGARVIHVDSEAARIGEFARVDIGIVGDARASVRAVESALAHAEISHASAWMAPPMQPRIAAAQAAVPLNPPTASDKLPIDLALQQLDGILPPNRYIAVDAGLILGFAFDHIAVPGPDSWLWTADFGSIGLALSMGMGAALARPDSHVVVLSGDGGLMMNYQEIETAAREQIPVTVIALNDAAYAAEVRLLESHELPTPLALFDDVDFAAVARAFGAAGVTVRTEADLSAAARAIDGRKGPLVIDVKISEDESHRLLEAAGFMASGR